MLDRKLSIKLDADQCSGFWKKSLNGRPTMDYGRTKVAYYCKKQNPTCYTVCLFCSVRDGFRVTGRFSESTPNAPKSRSNVPPYTPYHLPPWPAETHTASLNKSAMYYLSDLTYAGARTITGPQVVVILAVLNIYNACLDDATWKN